MHTDMMYMCTYTYMYMYVYMCQLHNQGMLSSNTPLLLACLIDQIVVAERRKGSSAVVVTCVPDQMALSD